MIAYGQASDENSRWPSPHKALADHFNPQTAQPSPPQPRLWDRFETEAVSSRYSQPTQRHTNHQTWPLQHCQVPPGTQYNTGHFAHASTQQPQHGTAASYPATRSVDPSDRPHGTFQQAYNANSTGVREGQEPPSRPGLSSNRSYESSYPGPQVTPQTVLDRALWRSPSAETLAKEDEDDSEDMNDDQAEAAECDGTRLPDQQRDCGPEREARLATAADKRAAIRRMKRFRLTHQQTRFLMSEFAKQPHPDAATRERLSRQIDGYSPRQVQVWFQNRRANMKRHPADERERVIKMRALPEDFDNVQALHAPYGAVHNLGVNNQSPSIGSAPDCYAPPQYPDHMIRPLVTDTRRSPDSAARASPQGLIPAFSSFGFTTSPPASIGTTTELLSPLPTPSSDRFAPYGSRITPTSTGPLTPPGSEFTRQSCLDSLREAQMQCSVVQPLQQQQRRQLVRDRAMSLQSAPLRTGVPWKATSSFDLEPYSTMTSPQLRGRHAGVVCPVDSLGGDYGALPPVGYFERGPLTHSHSIP